MAIILPDQKGQGTLLVPGAVAHVAGASNLCLGVHSVHTMALGREEIASRLDARWRDMSSIFSQGGVLGAGNDRIRLGVVRAVSVGSAGCVAGCLDYRAGLAQSLAPRRDILLLDEPLSNLQPALRLAMTEWIREEIQFTRAACIWVAHDEAEADGVANRRLRLADGKLTCAAARH